jgi:hypothetical protein
VGHHHLPRLVVVPLGRQAQNRGRDPERPPQLVADLAYIDGPEIVDRDPRERPPLAFGQQQHARRGRVWDDHIDHRPPVSRVAHTSIRCFQFVHSPLRGHLQRWQDSTALRVDLPWTTRGR